jgi:hypothetical protein
MEFNAKWSDEKLKEMYPIFGKETDSKVSNVLNKKELLEYSFINKLDCPVKVWAHNFRGVASKAKSSVKPHCDLLVLEYPENEGVIKVGDIIKSVRLDNYIKADGTPINHNPFSFRRAAISYTKKKERIKVTEKYIKGVCIEEGLDYRPFTLKRVNNTGKCIFWHPTYSYSKPILVDNWLENKNDPFHIQRHEIDVVNRAKLAIFDNNLSNLYEVIDKKVIQGELGHKSVNVFCKLHGETSVARVNNIEKYLTFNCPLCRKKDFGGVKRLQQLKHSPELDQGTTVVALMSLKVDGRKTLKFGITSMGLSHESDLEWLNRRYGAKKIIKKNESHRCKTEFEARTLEQYMLTETLNYLNDKVSPDFGGFTECRLTGDKSLRTCTRVFFDALSLLDP